jgi:hypothetical protein
MYWQYFADFLKVRKLFCIELSLSKVETKKKSRGAGCASALREKKIP